MKIVLVPVLVLILAGSACQSSAGEWSQFLGPNRNGVVTTGNQIPAKPKLNLVWSRDLGSGFSGILVSEGRLFTMHKQGKNDVMTCMKADTGETVWQYDIAPFFAKEGAAPGGALSTPALDEEQVYGLGPRGEFFALRKDSGKQVWKVHLEDDLGGVPPGVGFTTSPLVVGNRVIVQIGNAEEGKSIGAFDTKSGELVWSSGTGAGGIQSPSLVEFLGQSYLIALYENGISGLDPETGKVLWNHAGKAGIQVLPTSDDSFLINVGSGYVHYQLTKKDKTTVLKELWSNEILQFLYDIPVVHNDLAFGFKNKIVTSLNLRTGERAWQERMPAGGTTTVVDGHLVIWCNGEIRLAKVSGKAYEEVAVIKILDDEEGDSYTMPSYANGQFYVRNLDKIAAVEVSN